MQAQLTMTDYAPVCRFHRIVGVGQLRERQGQKPQHASSLTWYVSNREDFLHVFTLLRPWLSARRVGRAEQILAWQLEQRAAVRRRIEERCRNGHWRTPENTRRTVDAATGRPHFYCLECNRIRQRAKRLEAKLAA